MYDEGAYLCPAYSPKYKNKQYEQREEDSNIIHGPEHDKELTTQLGHKSHQLENTQETESPEH